jgi:D-alanine-D-alanine ligase
LKILLLHTLAPKEYSGGRVADEFDLNDAAWNVSRVLAEATVLGVEGRPQEIIAILEAHRPDVVFNLCEAPMGQPSLEAHVAALLEWLGMAFTGSGSETLALCRRKDRMNAVLAAHDVPIPGDKRFPLIVKPADEDGSAGMHSESICEDEVQLARAKERWPGPVVIQEFLPGREFVVSMWGRNEPDHVSVGETKFQNGLRLITYSSKWDVNSADFANSPLEYHTDIEPPLRESLISIARRSWAAAEARGYIRVDVRCDASGHPFVLDVNPNPELGPGVGICRGVQEAGWEWEKFVRCQVEWALAR